jgi:GDP-mannose 6-dehydrogenase
VKIAVFGLGYVGTVTAACLAQKGHEVVGVDVNQEKVRRVRSGKSPVFEPGLSDLVAEGVRVGHLSATSDPVTALNGAHVAMICVGTPSLSSGGLDLTYVERVAHDIGRGLASAASFPVACVRSTMLPGSHAQVIANIEDASGLTAGLDFGYCANPEFLREGSAIKDFNQPSLTIIGELDPPSGDRIQELYADLPAPLYRVPLGVAEMVKYAGNAFHALKVVFANEIGTLSKALGMDGRQVMDIFVADEKLNISSRYLKPGFAYGGSCLGKDLRAVLHAARNLDIALPVLAAVPSSNSGHIERLVHRILDLGERDIAVIGLSFKPGTDDLRESPLVDLVERLVGKGMHVRIFDREVSLSKLQGTNLDYIERTLPHVASLLRPTIEEAVKDAGVVIYGKSLESEDRAALMDQLTSGQLLLDLAGLDEADLSNVRGSYDGIAW